MVHVYRRILVGTKTSEQSQHVAPPNSLPRGAPIPTPDEGSFDLYSTNISFLAWDAPQHHAWLRTMAFEFNREGIGKIWGNDAAKYPPCARNVWTRVDGATGATNGDSRGDLYLRVKRSGCLPAGKLPCWLLSVRSQRSKHGGEDAGSGIAHSPRC